LDVASDMKISDTSRFREIKEKRDTFRNNIGQLEGECNNLNKKKMKLDDALAELSDENTKKKKIGHG